MALLCYSTLASVNNLLSDVPKGRVLISHNSRDKRQLANSFLESMDVLIKNGARSLMNSLKQRIKEY